MTFKVTAHVFNMNFQDSGRSGIAGRMTFVCHDHALASHIARSGLELPDNHTANVDFEMALPIGRRTTWVDCNIRSLEQAAETLMQAAHNIRQAARLRDVKDAAE